MKILLPYLQSSDDRIDSPNVIGGLEKFCRDIYQNFDNVIPIHISRAERQNRDSDKIMLRAISQYEPDLIFTNFDNAPVSSNLQKFNIPIVWISHVGSGHVARIPVAKRMKKFTNNGGVLAMVSNFQYQGMTKMSKRIHDFDLDIYEEFINPSYTQGDETTSNDIQCDLITIGRMDKEKNLFFVHKVGSKNGIRSKVYSNSVNLNIQENQDYFDQNSHWKHPQETIMDKTHTEIMNDLKHAACYATTCNHETWGITTLESLARGVPNLVVTKKNGIHAAETITPNSRFIRKVPNNLKSDEFKNLYNQLIQLDRNEISEQTKEKHSKEKWMSSISKLMDYTIDRHGGKEKLFFL